MSALDFFGLSDNRIALYRFANTQSIGAFIEHQPARWNCSLRARVRNPPLAPQPQNPVTDPGERQPAGRLPRARGNLHAGHRAGRL